MTEQLTVSSAESPSLESLSELSTPAVAERMRLPETRVSVTHKFNISGHEGYIIVGRYEDGRPGEVFLKMAKQGSTVSGLMDTIGILTSLALQYGVPVEALADKFEYSRFEPAGWTKNPEIGYARSIIDYVFRWLGREFSAEYRDARPPLQSMAEEGAASTTSIRSD